MKKIADFIKSNAKQILEVAALFAVIILPWIVNLQELFKVYIESNSLTPDNLWWYFALTCGNPIASLILFCALLLVLRKINCDYVMPESRKVSLYQSLSAALANIYRSYS